MALTGGSDEEDEGDEGEGGGPAKVVVSGGIDAVLEAERRAEEEGEGEEEAELSHARACGSQRDVKLAEYRLRLAQRRRRGGGAAGRFKAPRPVAAGPDDARGPAPAEPTAAAASKVTAAPSATADAGSADAPSTAHPGGSDPAPAPARVPSAREVEDAGLARLSAVLLSNQRRCRTQLSEPDLTPAVARAAQTILRAAQRLAERDGGDLSEQVEKRCAVISAQTGAGRIIPIRADGSVARRSSAKPSA